jgi:hypothetical protein
MKIAQKCMKNVSENPFVFSEKRDIDFWWLWSIIRGNGGKISGARMAETQL